MADRRTEEEIEQTAMTLCAVAFDHDGPMSVTWARLSDKQKEGWRRVARAVRGVVHFESATSGGFATAPQADRIREFREKYLMEDGRERSWIGSETRPYGDMVVLFEHPGSAGLHRDTNWRVMGWIIHPDGQYEELHQERVS